MGVCLSKKNDGTFPPSKIKSDMQEGYGGEEWQKNVKRKVVFHATIHHFLRSRWKTFGFACFSGVEWVGEVPGECVYVSQCALGEFGLLR